MHLTKLLACAILPAALATLAHAGVDIVGKPQLGTFGTIQAAIDAAADGDILLVVDSGTYPGFTITNKSVSVIVTPGALVDVQGTCEIRNLGATRRVSLVGLDVTALEAPGGPSRAALELLDNLGIVRLQGCSFLGSLPQTVALPPLAPSGSGAVITRSSKVLLTHCELRGRDVGWWSGLAPRAGGAGLRSTDSAVALYDCVVRGGRGSEETYPSGGDGGAACVVNGWGLFASGTAMTGATGGGGDYVGCTTSGNGGDGITIAEGQAQLHDSAIVRGPAGSFFNCTSGVGGRRIAATNSVVNEYGTVRRSLSGPRVASDNTQISFHFTGLPGDSVFLLVGVQPVFSYLPNFAGISTIRPPWVPIPVGTVGPSGSLVIPYPIPDIQSPQAGFFRHFQAYAVQGQEQVVSSPHQVLIFNN